jgi:hypothetical protein
VPLAATIASRLRRICAIASARHRLAPMRTTRAHHKQAEIAIRDKISDAGFWGPGIRRPSIRPIRSSRFG